MSLNQGYDTPYPTNLQTGDVQDDDAAVFDQYFETTAVPPDPAAATQPFEDHSRVPAPKPQRMLSGFQTITSSSSGIQQVAWPDVTRKKIVLRFFSSDPSDFIRVAGNQNDLTSNSLSSGLGGRVYAGESLEFDGYTGPLYIGDLAIAGTGVVSWWITAE